MNWLHSLLRPQRSLGHAKQDAATIDWPREVGDIALEVIVNERLFRLVGDTDVAAAFLDEGFRGVGAESVAVVSALVVLSVTNAFDLAQGMKAREAIEESAGVYLTVMLEKKGVEGSELARIPLHFQVTICRQCLRYLKAVGDDENLDELFVASVPGLPQELALAVFLDTCEKHSTWEASHSRLLKLA